MTNPTPIHPYHTPSHAHPARHCLLASTPVLFACSLAPILATLTMKIAQRIEGTTFLSKTKSAAIYDFTILGIPMLIILFGVILSVTLVFKTAKQQKIPKHLIPIIFLYALPCQASVFLISLSAYE